MEFYNGVLVPGFVNAHCHLELSHLRGAIASGCGMAGFVQAMRAQRHRFSPEAQLAAARYHAARMRAEGVFLIADVCNSARSFAVKSENPENWHNFLELYGLRTKSAESLRPTATAADAAGLAWSITPHAAHSLNRDAFAAAIEGFSTDKNSPATKNPPLSIHFLESDEERALFRQKGPLWAWYREEDFPMDFTEYKSPAERILAEIPAHRNLMLIHNTFVAASEIEALQAHFGDHLTWVLCPRSNRHITGAQPPVELLRRHGARIALGTDSLASNSDLSMLEEMKMFAGVPLDEVLSWATAHGARLFNCDDRYGTFEVGKRSSIVLLEGIDWKQMKLLPAASARRLS